MIYPKKIRKEKISTNKWIKRKKARKWQIASLRKHKNLFINFLSCFYFLFFCFPFSHTLQSYDDYCGSLFCLFCMFVGVFVVASFNDTHFGAEKCLFIYVWLNTTPNHHVISFSFSLYIFSIFFPDLLKKKIK